VVLMVSAAIATFSAEPAATAALAQAQGTVAAAGSVGAPTLVSARPLHGSARVSWHAPTAPSGRTLVSYVIRATGGVQVTAPASAHAVTVPGLADGWWHAFVVTATYDNGLKVASLRSARVALPVVSGWSTTVTGGRTAAVLTDAVQVRPAGAWTLQVERRRTAATHWTPDASLKTAADGTATVKLKLIGGSWRWRLSVVGTAVTSASRPVIASAHACVWGSAASILSAPARSGSGKRIIWSKSANQVWLVEKTGTVRCSYVVTDNDEDTPVGTYQVRSKSAMSSSIDEGRYWRLAHMVRFYIQPGHRLWIGFHAVPVSPSGQLIQPMSSLGKPGYKSHGCVRQNPTNAANLYAFAPVGTKVVVIA
jgi:hypothetical protein